MILHLLLQNNGSFCESHLLIQSVSLLPMDYSVDNGVPDLFTSCYLCLVLMNYIIYNGVPDVSQLSSLHLLSADLALKASVREYGWKFTG